MEGNLRRNDNVKIVAMYYYIKIRRFLKNWINLHKLKRFYIRSGATAQNDEQWVIYMCDGRRHHGGLGDRFSGLISTYAYCKEFGKKFKCNFVFPYSLEEFLEPNKYDWRIAQEDISYNKATSRPIYITYKAELEKQVKYARASLNHNDMQLHVYTNMKYFHPVNFKYLFDELFKPSKILQEAINRQLAELPQNYVSVTFRFQQLLGDLEEGNFPKLTTPQEREKLISDCLEFIEWVHIQNPDLKKFLVTSDSSTFLTRAQQLPYVYTIPGEIVHVDFNTKSVDLSVHMKSFIDFFLIGKASKIYSIDYPPLYHTGFPWLASMLYGNEYIELRKESILKK